MKLNARTWVGSQQGAQDVADRARRSMDHATIMVVHIFEKGEYKMSRHYWFAERGGYEV
jgi:hypothetical protein